jgi:hypothetical protein
MLLPELGPPAEIYIEEYVQKFRWWNDSRGTGWSLVFCEFLTLMACVEPSMYHLANAVLRRSIQALEGKAMALHIHIVPDLVGFLSWMSIL